MLTETLFLRRKDKKFQKNNLIVNLLELTQEGYDRDYEVSRIQTFISEFKDKQLKKLEKE